MKLNPQQAPLYGECVLTVQLDDEDVRSGEQEEEEKDKEPEFYLIFSGSTQRHVTSILRVSHVSLQAVCPAHNVCEQVLVSLCLARPGGPVDTHSQATFCFVQDSALDMAHFLLDRTAPQGVSLLEDEQIPLEQCERLDESLALALKHLSLPHKRTAPGTLSHTNVDKQMDNQTQTATVTNPNTQSDTHRHDTERHWVTLMDVSSLQDNCPVVFQCQQLSSLLHLAATYGLKTVASFLLQQPGGKEALRRTNIQGQTPACLAKTKGHQQLVELFTQYETFSNVQAETKEKLHFSPEGRVFQHHANLGTYTLTFPGFLQGEGPETDSSGGCCLQEEVNELRRLIELHRDTKEKSDFAHTHVSINQELVSPACGLQPCFEGQQESKRDADFAVVTIEHNSTTTTTEAQCGTPSWEGRTHRKDSTVVTHTTCTSGRQSQEIVRQQGSTAVANAPVGRNKKNNKRTTKTTRHATESPGNNRSTPEAIRETAQRPTKTTGSGTVSPREQAAASVTGDRGATKNQCCPGTQETLFPIKPVSRPGGNGKCAVRKAVACPTTAITEKQEGEKWEVEQLMCERMVATRTGAERDTRSLPAKEALESAAERTVTMGQEQSQNPQESQSDPEEASQSYFMNSSYQSGRRTSPKSPDMHRKDRRVIWRDGSWIGSTMVSSQHGATVWYHGEGSDPGANEDSNRKEVNSQSIWYDSDSVGERKDEQLEQGMREKREQDLSSPQASDLSSPQLLEQGLSSHQLSVALSQLHATGPQPALSHGPDAQREEVHRSQQEEEAKSVWKEGGVEGCREDFSNIGMTSSRKSSEIADVEGEGKEKRGSEEKGAKGRKKRRKKRGKRGDAEAKLCSSSSVESQTEIQTHKEQVTNEDGGFTTPELSQTDHMRTDLTQVTALQTIKTKGLSENESMSSHDFDDFKPDCNTIFSELCEIDIRKINLEEISTVPPMAKEVHDPTELDSKGPASLIQQTVDKVESEALSENENLTVAGKAIVSDRQTDLMKSICPKERPVKHSDPTELIENVLVVEFPEQNILQSLDSNKPVNSVDAMERPVGFLETLHPTEAASVIFEDREDVSPLQIPEGRAEATAREYSEYGLVSEMLRDQQHKEEKRNGLWEVEKETGKKKSWERDENDRGFVHGMDRGKQVEDESPSLDRDKEQNYDEDLVATAVAVVIVAIASAMASVELSQHLEDKNEIQTETTQNKFFTCSLPKEEDSRLNTQANERIAVEVNSHDGVEPNMLLHTESHLPCPAVDTGQDCVSEVNPTLVEHRDAKDQAICQKQEDRQQLDSHFPQNETHDRYGDRSVESTTAGSETGGQAEEGESCEGFTDMSDLVCQAKEHESHPLLFRTSREGEISALPLSCGSTLPVTPRDLASVANHIPEEPTAPVNDPSSQSSANRKFSAAIPFEADTCTSCRTGHECVAADNDGDVFDGLEDDSDVLHTLDGWEETDRSKTEREVEARKEITMEDMSQSAEAEPFPGAKEEESDSDSAHTLQIQRESDVLYPVQSSLEHSAVTDVHPDSEECVSVCLLHRDTVVKVCAELDDGAFEKPEDHPSCVGHMDKQVCVSWSSTDNASMQEVLSPSEGSDTVSPWNSRQSWKSETEDRGGRETERAGDEEKNDQLPENRLSSVILRASIRPLSPFRRHSWELGRNNTAAHTNITQHSSLHCHLSGEVKKAKPPLHRRSMSWCPSILRSHDQKQIDNRSYSLEGLEVGSAVVQTQCPSLSNLEERAAGRSVRLDSQERSSLVSLTEEEQEGDGSSIDSQTSHQVLSMTTSPDMFHHQIFPKSISMVTISHRDIDVSGFPRSKRRISFSLSISPLLPKTRRFFSVGSSSSDEEEEGGREGSFSSTSRSLGYSISEEEPGPLRSDTEVKGVPKISRTFSYLRSKMSKKGKEKEKERRGEGKRESKEREKQSASGHLFIPISPPASTACQHCSKLLHNKETFLCNNCGVHVHKSCTENLSVCAKSKTKQLLVPEAVPGSAVNVRSKSTSSVLSLSSTSSSSSRERWSTITTPDDQLPVMFPRRHPSIFNPHSNLAKSISTSNIAGLDDVPLKGLKLLSQSTDSLHQGSKVNASTESLTDEGTEMIDSQLMGEFECDIKDLEADSWSCMVDKKFLKTLKKDEIKRQDVIYELYLTEVHHVRTLKIMSEVYYKGLQKELQLDTQTLDKIFPVMDELVEIHSLFLTLLLERRRSSSTQGQNTNNFLICSIGGILVNQFSGCNSDCMKKAYGKFCSHHNEAVNLYKDLYAKDKRFQAFIKKIMSSSVVRRLSIPECILLVTQRITKYPVLIQRILQHTKDSDEDHSCVSEALCCVKELIMAVDNKVNEQEKKLKLREVYSRTDSKSIMRMKSGQMFAKEDLIRGRKLLHDGALQLKNSTGRLKDVHAMLLSDVLVFLQEKDQKYVFASLDQRSTVISLQNLIVREVANEERGLFLITAGIERPEMVEVLASSKEERNTWRAIIQEAMHCMEKDEDEGVPSETEEDRRQQENRVKEIRERLRRKDEKIVSLLEEKVHIFRELGDCNPAPDDTNPQVREQMLFRATPDNFTKGEPIINDALREVETLQALVRRGVGEAGCNVPIGLTEGSVGPVCLPRRAETFGGFDSHQMNSSKNGERDEGEESLDLRRTESDSVLKRAVVVQQDSFIEDQQQAVNNRLTSSSSRHSSSSSLSSSSSSRPSSLIEQEKHRSLERQRQEAASLQKQQAAHQEEKRKREKEWELKENGLAEREERLMEEEKKTKRRRQELMEETNMLQKKKEEYQRELERMREAQRRLERDKEALTRDIGNLDVRRNQAEQLQRYQQTPFSTSEDYPRFHRSGSLDLDSNDAAEQQKKVELSSSAPTKEPFLRIGSKRMGKTFNPFSSASTAKPLGAEKECQLPTRLLQLGKPKEKKDKKKKKGKGEEQTETENKVAMMLDPQNEGGIFFC